MGEYNQFENVTSKIRSDLSDVCIGYAIDNDVRYKATSGGIGSAIVKYLLDSGSAKSALSFTFNRCILQYEPQIIYKSDEYKISGSIYHEIELVQFIKKQINQIKSPFICFALPCQVRPIRNILSKNGIDSYIIQLVCSSQQSFEATEYLLKRLKINKDDILNIQYRGHGWPGGIQISLKNGENTFIENNNSLWTDIFHSKLFCMPRCFHCNPQMTSFSDIIIADPWRIDQISSEKMGRTLCCVKTNIGIRCINQMLEKGIIRMELIDERKFLYSQEGVIKKKQAYIRHRSISNSLKCIFTNSIYRRVVLSNPLFFKCHLLIKIAVEKIILK